MSRLSSVRLLKNLQDDKYECKMQKDISESFSITNTTKGKLPRLPFSEMKKAVLGKFYSLSLVIAGNSLSRKLNLTYRGKNRATSVLSFSLDAKQGEIFLNLEVAKREAPLHKRSRDNFAGFLFIHALMHLKGFTHSSRMEKQETKFRRRFGI